jgi:hypothetical protein
MVDFAKKLEENKMAQKLIDVMDLEFAATPRQLELESFILLLADALKGSTSSEDKNKAVVDLRYMAISINKDKENRNAED